MPEGYSAENKIYKKEKPTEFEMRVCNAIFDLESGAEAELKQELRSIYISHATEVNVGKGRKAILIFVPYVLLSTVRRIQIRLVRELEKKFNGQHVIILGKRTILTKSGPNDPIKRQKRPFSRTVKNVHSEYMSDVVYPAEITGKRIRTRLDGSKLHKVQLNKKDQQSVEAKLETFEQVYKKVTGKEVKFSF